MKLKEEISQCIKDNGVNEDAMGLVENLPLALKFDIVEIITKKLIDSNCNNPVYGGFSYRLPFIQMISLYNQATDIHKHASYTPYIKYTIKFAERLLKAHEREIISGK